jgi:hypothetical protein
MTIMWDPEVVDKKQVTLTEAPGDVDLARRNTAALIDHWDSRGYGLWTVVEKASGQIIVPSTVADAGRLQGASTGSDLVFQHAKNVEIQEPTHLSRSGLLIRSLS